LAGQAFFDHPNISQLELDNKFEVKAELSYPHLFSIVFESDKNVITSRPGPFYIDNSANSISVNNSSEEYSTVNGHTFEEYQNKFIPFFFAKKGGYDCKSNPIVRFIHDKSSEFDSKLSDYVLQNPDSYVALWSLIERFSLFGHSDIREKTLVHFSKKVKNEKLWPIINSDLKNAGIKENRRFPVFTVKTQELKEQKLSLPKAQYTLVDFWFSRCRPCLEFFPALKSLYATYQSRGFGIVSITTDKTNEIPLWHKRIKEHELSWVQYLDENAAEAKKLMIHSFPATFLLNQKGELIKKDISPKELEAFLKEHL
jgi:thiol-disulfide isomerase/thioredoxin